ncbi:HAD family hydrolase [Methanosarcina sp. WH1]|uniref:HAD family hydrolase n=1 Tax=Methanosarcina sp. WH1 TaxID=1434102 RepID=UPI00064F0B38|nr:HAD family hydrolase [Methanosarcina sp. WH1]
MDIKIKYIVSDFNGTLVDAMPIYTRVFCDVVKRQTGIESPNVAAYSIAATGTPWDEQFSHILEQHKLPKDAVPKLMDEFCTTIYDETYSLFPKTEALLKLFKTKGYRVFITSGSGTGPMMKRLYEVGIFPYIDCLLGFDIYKKGPKHIEMLAEKEGLSLKQFALQSVYFGDGPGDMQLAKNAGLFAIGVAQTVDPELLKEAGADLVIAKIGDALEMDWEKLEISI